MNFHLSKISVSCVSRTKNRATSDAIATNAPTSATYGHELLTPPARNIIDGITPTITNPEISVPNWKESPEPEYLNFVGNDSANRVFCAPMVNTVQPNSNVSAKTINAGLRVLSRGKKAIEASKPQRAPSIIVFFLPSFSETANPRSMIITPNKTAYVT